MSANRIITSAVLLVFAALAVTTLRQHAPPTPRYARFDSDEIKAGLDRRIRLVSFQDWGTLRARLDWLEQQTHTKIELDREALSSALGDDDPRYVGVELHDVTLAAALDVLLDQYIHRFGAQSAAYDVAGDVIRVTSSEKVTRFARLYDVRDLLNFTELPPVVQLNSPAAGPSPGTAPPNLRDAEHLATLVGGFVKSDDWFNDGGIRGCADRLVVLQTRQRHKEVARFLEQLRAGGIGWQRSAVRRPLADFHIQIGEPIPPEIVPANDLRRRIPALDLNNVPLYTAIDQLRELWRANIVVNWRVLDGDNISLASPVTLRLRDVSLGEALSAVLFFNPVADQVGYVVRDEWISISTVHEFNPFHATRIYDVRELLTAINKYLPQGPRKSRPVTLLQDLNGDAAETLQGLIEEATNANIWRNNGGSMQEWGGKLVVDQSPANQFKVETLLRQLCEPGQPAMQVDQPPDPDLGTCVRIYDVAALIAQFTKRSGCTHSEAADLLLKRITEGVSPQSWYAAGGPWALAECVAGKLIIVQTLANQIKVAEHLQQLGGATTRGGG